MKTSQPISTIRVLETDRLKIELLLEEDDKNKLLEVQEQNYADDYIKTLYSGHPKYVTFKSETKYNVECKYERNRGLNQNGNTFYKLFYIIKTKSDSCVIGALELYVSGGLLEFGLFIDKGHSNQSFGKEALNRGIQLVKDVLPQGTQMKWECYVDNVPSCKLAESCGFTKSGDDVYMYNIDDIERYGRTYLL